VPLGFARNFVVFAEISRSQWPKHAQIQTTLSIIMTTLSSGDVIFFTSVVPVQQGAFSLKLLIKQQLPEDVLGRIGATPGG
jgi:hypothetical protein